MIAVLALLGGIVGRDPHRADGAVGASALPADRRGRGAGRRLRWPAGPAGRVFDDKQFVISFVSNVLVAAFIVYLGDQLGVGGQLSTGVVVVLGVRIFSNVAAIRRHLFRA